MISSQNWVARCARCFPYGKEAQKRTQAPPRKKRGQKREAGRLPGLRRAAVDLAGIQPGGALNASPPAWAGLTP